MTRCRLCGLYFDDVATVRDVCDPCADAFPPDDRCERIGLDELPVDPPARRFNALAFRNRHLGRGLRSVRRPRSAP